MGAGAAGASSTEQHGAKRLKRPLEEEEGAKREKHGAEGGQQKVLYAGFAFPCVADPA